MSESKQPKKLHRLTLDNPSLTDIQRKLMMNESSKQFQKHRSKFRSRVGIHATALFAFVGSVYGYTIYTMSQDNFLSDIDIEANQETSRT